MILHPIKSMQCTRLGSAILLLLSIGVGVMWYMTNVFLSWLLTGQHIWMYRFDQPWPGRFVPIAMWTFWLSPFLAPTIGVDWHIVSMRTARKVVIAFAIFTVVGLIYWHTFAITPQCKAASRHVGTAQAEAAFNAACAQPLKLDEGTRP